MKIPLVNMNIIERDIVECSFTMEDFYSTFPSLNRECSYIFFHDRVLAELKLLNEVRLIIMSIFF